MKFPLSIDTFIIILALIAITIASCIVYYRDSREITPVEVLEEVHSIDTTTIPASGYVPDGQLVTIEK